VLDGRVTELGEKVTVLDEKVTVLDGRVTELGEKVTVLDEKVTVLDGRVTEMGGKVTALDGRVVTLEEKVDVIDGKVTVLDSKADKIYHELKTDIQEARQEILAGVKFSYAELERRLTTLEKEFLELKLRVEKIENRSTA
ncbi:MAG: hypothetical protein ACPL6D_06250, partial [Thermodesulfobacteriota bacterium]